MRSQITSNLLNIQIPLSRTTTIRTDLNPGSVMCQNCCQALAPSTRAASYSWFGIVCRPASTHVTTNGVQIQTLTSTIVPFAVDDSAPQSNIPSPNDFRISFISP